MDSYDFEQISQNEEHWISAADLLGGALIIFILLMLYFLMTEREQSRQFSEIYQQTVTTLEQKLSVAQVTTDSVKEVAVLYDQKRTQLYEQLVQEFASDLDQWNAEIDEDLTVRFNEPDVLFAVGSSQLRNRFIRILDDFFPRYMALITSEDFRDSITELRIEGHTSSFWNRENPPTEQVAYLKNMDLSFERSRSVLRHVTELPKVQDELPWLRKHLTANGLSSSRLILDKDGNELTSRSQRVEFRVRTDVESRITKILDAS